jgi:DedD protein
MVQIAAVSRQEDANTLANALQKHGYTVSVRNEPQDKLYHVQVGPFASRDAARAMRSRLLADGYNAILKP